MVLKALKTFSPKDIELSRIQDNISQAMDPILSKILLDYQIIESIALTGGVDKTINHGLGRNPKWIVIDCDADTRIFSKQSTNLQKNATLILRSVNTANISILIF